MRTISRTWLAMLVVWTLAGVAAAQEAAREEVAAEAPPPLAIEAIEVSPERPGAQTLCRLAIRVRNGGERPATALELEVRSGGVELEVYRNQLFMDLLAPGEVSRVELFNFWTSESDRPAPADGNLALEVVLAGASWVEITQGDDGAEVWTLTEAVPGLPVSRRLVVPLGSTSAP